MSSQTNILHGVVVLAILAASPSLLFAGGRPRIRNAFQRPLAGAVKSNLPLVADGVLAAHGVSPGAGKLAQNLPLRNRDGNCGGSAAPMSDPIPSYPAPKYAEPTAPAAPVPAVASRSVVAEARGADLVLEEVKLFDDATLVAGPAYSVRYRNQGVQPTGNFTVAIVASLDGKLQHDAPRVVMEVNSLYHGATQELVLRLPRCKFNYLIVMIDATGVVSELDESNNSAVLERGSL